VAFNGIEGLRLDSTEPPTSGDFKPTPVLAYRECRKTGPRIATSWAVFDLAGYELGGAVSENPAAAPAELLAVLDKLNQIDPAVLTEFEARSLYVRQCDPTQDGFDLAYQKEVALRPIEAMGIWGGRLCDENLEKLAPTVAKLLEEINGPRRLTLKEQTEVDRRAAEEAEAAAEAEHRDRLNRDAFEMLMGDALEALGTTDRRRGAALINMAFGVPRQLRPEVLADFLEAEDDIDEVAA
ncbi:MAG: hypothetical protein JWM57_2086, partial [Phycisphaerales bacterium]|nr:hypothetical protein [Phycisphaerales bacterium]